MPFALEAALIERFVRALGWPLGTGVIEPQLRGFEAETDREVGALRVFTTGYGTFALTSRDHIYRYRAPELTDKEVRIDAVAAHALAIDFARRVTPDLERDFVEQRPKGMPGNRPSSYVFRWRQRPRAPQVSIYPNEALAFVALDKAAVTQFLLTDLAFARTEPPGVDEAGARRRALEITGGGVVEAIELHEVPYEGGARARTLWTVQVLSKGGFHGIVYQDVELDADSGEHVATHGY
jgi:hypothetical protein